MSNPAIVTPTIIQGPAFVKTNSVVFYVEKDISLNPSVESWNPESTWGPLGERHKSRKDVLSFTPVGMVNSTIMNLVYAAFLAPSGKIGTSIYPGTVVISSLIENKTYTWARGGFSKPPGLVLSPTKTAFGSMEVTCIGAASTQPTDAAFWKTDTGAATADTTFDPTKVLSEIYSAALGARIAPYNALGAMDGFMLDFGFLTKDIPNSDVGIADTVITGLSLGVRFAPSNLTEDQVDTLLATQDTAAVLPGQAYGKLLEDLVITSCVSGNIFTAKKIGAKNCTKIYAVGEHRFREIQFTNIRTFTTGAPDAMFAYTLM